MTAAEFAQTRHRLGLTQKQLAERLGVTVKTVKWLEGARRPVTERTALQLREIVEAARHDQKQREAFRRMGSTPTEALLEAARQVARQTGQTDEKDVVDILPEVAQGVGPLVLRAFGSGLAPPLTPAEWTAHVREGAKKLFSQVAFLPFARGRDRMVDAIADEHLRLLRRFDRDKKYPQPTEVPGFVWRLGVVCMLGTQWLRANNMMHAEGDPRRLDDAEMTRVARERGWDLVEAAGERGWDLMQTGADLYRLPLLLDGPRAPKTKANRVRPRSTESRTSKPKRRRQRCALRPRSDRA